MKRFLRIVNSKIISERIAKEIVDGEIEDDGTYGNIGQILVDDKWIDDPVIIAEQEKQARIFELKRDIAEKKLLDMDCTSEQAELKELLGYPKEVVPVE